MQQAWESRDHPNLLILNYEDVNTNFMKEIRKLNSFLGTNLSEEQMLRIKDFTSFKEMKNREDNEQNKLSFRSAIYDKKAMKNEGGFFRKGRVSAFLSQAVTSPLYIFR